MIRDLFILLTLLTTALHGAFGCHWHHGCRPDAGGEAAHHHDGDGHGHDHGEPAPPGEEPDGPCQDTCYQVAAARPAADPDRPSSLCALPAPADPAAHLVPLPIRSRSAGGSAAAPSGVRAHLWNQVWLL